MMGAATEKSRLPRFSLVLGIESCCEVADLSCLGMLEKEGRKEGNLYFDKMKYSTILSALKTITKTAMRSLS